MAAELIGGVWERYCIRCWESSRPFTVKIENVSLEKFVKENCIIQLVYHLLYGLLTKDPTHWLGSGPKDAEEIKPHPFFASIA